MSLLLRNALQPLLDNNDLGIFHADVKQEGPDYPLQILGECNKPLMSIHGITFNRRAPAKEEIPIAVELFDAFLVKHGNAIREYVKAKQAFMQKEKPKKSVGGFYRIVGVDYDDTKGPWTLTWKDKHFWWKTNYNKAQEAISLVIVDNTEFTTEQHEIEVKLVNQYKFSVARQTAAVKKFHEYITYMDSMHALRDMEIRLNSCEI